MEQNEVTFRDYLRVLFRHKSVIVITFLTVMITTYIGLKLKTPLYQASVKILISGKKATQAPYYRDIAGYQTQEIVLTQSEIVKSNPVIERAVKILKLDKRPLDYEKKFCSPLKAWLIERKLKYFNPLSKIKDPKQKEYILFKLAVEDLRRRLKIQPVRDTDIFTISVKDFDPMMAAITANVVSRCYIIFDLEQQLAELQLKYGKNHPMVKQLKDNIKKMVQTVTGQPLPIIEAIGPASVKIIEQASPPLRPVGLPKSLIMGLSFFMSIFLGIMLSFLFEYLDQRLKSPQEIERYLELNYLGSVPKKGLRESLLIKNTEKKSTYLKFYSILSQEIQLLLKDKNWRTVLFVASLPKEGVSTVVSNLGIYLSQKLNCKVCIVDANLRRPKIHTLFNLPKSLGLCEVLEGKVSFKEVLKRKGENLYILPAGKTLLNPVLLLSSLRFQNLVDELKNEFEIILFDAPNLKEFKDAKILSQMIEGVILIVDETSARRQVVRNLIEPLREKIIGAILNKRRLVIPKIIYENI